MRQLRRRTRTRGWQSTFSGPTGLAMIAPFLVAAAVFIVYPFVELLRTAFGEPNGFGNVSDFLKSPAARRTLWTTCFTSLIVTVIVVGLGAVLAWSLRTTRSRLTRMVIAMAVFVPLWMGAVMKIYAFTVLLERFGVVNRTLTSIGLIDEPVQLLRTQFAVVAGMTYQMLPYAVLPMYAVYVTIDLNLIQAAESMGASRVRALRDVVTPLALPGLLASTVIVYVICIGYYLTPVLLGGATAPFTASLIADDIFNLFQPQQAAVSSVLLLIVAGIVILGGLRLVGKERMRRALG
ncbi:putative spermidine/putrescine transport system permease protein [Actinomadura pelletieri DSM 43383]|uniref:Putative spermidine/putrescine transport system permease protein n=1 Tax=Actinomadura pelletieri DSM 43383 TaxID=1120940 RepID=A0A495QA30_9ACTN|nr:ABC transporter permease [Actinomadura pelletieri]RKS68368.1 putative spermidine/putrescine transport system permease protein [Actinomadura pelletieri DSM 43383]